MLVVYVSNAIGFILDDTTMQSFAIMASNPIMGLIGGPGYGFEHISVPLIIVGIYGLYIMLATALMSITTISRHTRIEEQTRTGRANTRQRGRAACTAHSDTHRGCGHEHSYVFRRRWRVLFFRGPAGFSWSRVALQYKCGSSGARLWRGSPP